MDGIGGPQLRHAGLNLADEPREFREHVESDVFGFWIFLMSDAVLFALLFAIYGTSLGATVGAPGPAQEFKIGPSSSRRCFCSRPRSPSAWPPSR